MKNEAPASNSFFISHCPSLPPWGRWPSPARPDEVRPLKNTAAVKKTRLLQRKRGFSHQWFLSNCVMPWGTSNALSVA